MGDGVSVIVEKNVLHLQETSRLKDGKLLMLEKSIKDETYI